MQKLRPIAGEVLVDDNRLNRFAVSRNRLYDPIRVAATLRDVEQDQLPGALRAMIAGAKFAPPAPSSWVGALDLAESLTVRGVPFREAHHIVGRVVAELTRGGQVLSDASLEFLQTIDARFEATDLERLSPEASVRERGSAGGGSPASVVAQIAKIRDFLG